MHPLNTPDYLRDVIRPAVAAGAAAAGRSLADIEFAINPFFATGSDATELAQSVELIRKHISFYAATASYAAVMCHHGWDGVGERLIALSREGRWDEMPALVSDAMLETFAIVGLLDELPQKLAERYGGLVDAVNVVFGPPYAALQPRQRDLFVRLGPVLPALQLIAGASCR